MKYLSVAIALAIAAPAAAFDNHGMQGHQMQGEGHEPMMCCEGTTEEREACRERIKRWVMKWPIAKVITARAMGTIACIMAMTRMRIMKHVRTILHPTNE